MIARRFASLAGFFALATLSSTALAEKPARKTSVVELKTVEVFGRPQRPLVTVDIARSGVKLPLGEPRADFLDRVEAASRAAPF